MRARGPNTTGGEPPSYHGKNTHDGAIQRPDGRKEDSPSSRTKLLDSSRTTRSNVYPVGAYDIPKTIPGIFLTVNTYVLCLQQCDTND